MSYIILYRKQFIRVSGTEFIPMVKMGISNSPEDKSWMIDHVLFKTNFIQIREDIISKIYRLRDKLVKDGIYLYEKYNDERFIYKDEQFGWHAGLALNGRYPTTTTFHMFINYYLSGFERAKTVEQLDEKGIKVVMKMNPYYYDEIKSRNLSIKHDVLINGTEHLINIIQEFKEYYRNDFKPYNLTCLNI